HHEPQHEFFNRLGSTIKERHVLPGFFHDTLGEKNREKALRLARSFIRARFDEQPAIVDVTHADRSGQTREEQDRLATPLAMLSPRGLYWSATRAAMKIGGALSAGIKLGHDTGFDSGSTLDYVYRNEPAGKSAIGKFIDRNYLNSIGWRGIRQRKVNLEELIRDAMQRVHDGGSDIHVMDIAAGHGRYVLEAIDAANLKAASILLRDYSDINVQKGSELIASKGLGSIARFVKGDAFDRASLAAVSPRLAIAGRHQRCGQRGRISRLHLPAVASATRIDRARAHQSSRRRSVGDAAPHAKRD